MARRRIVLDRENLARAAERSLSWSQLHREVPYPLNGNSYRILKRNCQEAGIDTSHFIGKRNSGSGVGPVNHNYTRLEDIFAGAACDPKTLKRKLFESGLKEQKCEDCGTGTAWNGKPLTLQLEHVDGCPANNQLDNLKILCPNCHTQTPTWGAKRR